MQKNEVIFLLGDPDFLLGRRNLARISRSFGDLTRDKQTTDAATETEGSHTKVRLHQSQLTLTIS